MLVRRLNDCPKLFTAGGRAQVVRMVVKADGAGFSLSDVRFGAGNESVLWYKHHCEVNYVIGGRGEVEDFATGSTWTIGAGDVYIVGPTDRHRLRAIEELHIISMLNPPIVGDEQHDADGVFSASGADTEAATD